jgi:hypothetical protein
MIFLFFSGAGADLSTYSERWPAPLKNKKKIASHSRVL